MLRFTSNSRIAKMKTVTKITNLEKKHLWSTSQITPNVLYQNDYSVRSLFSAISVKNSELCHSCKLQLHIWWFTAAV